MWKICFTCAIFLCKLFKVWWNLICQWSESNCTTASVSNSRRGASRQLPPSLAQPICLSRESNGWTVIFGRKIYLHYWNQDILKLFNCQVLLRKKTDSHLVKMKRMNTLLKNSKQRGQFNSHVVTEHLVRVALESERMFHDGFWQSCALKLSIFFWIAQLHPWPLDPRLLPYRKWLFLILFHKLPNSFHRNPLPCRHWTQQRQSCAVSWSAGHACVVSNSSQLPPQPKFPQPAQ